jgi:hypothetical protein
MISTIPARTWTQERLSFFSDLIATATVVDSKPLDEIAVWHGFEGTQFRGMETTFSILKSFKGAMPSEGTVVVHHYSLANEESAENKSLQLQTFDSGSRHTYLLYLRNGSHKRFQPTSGQSLQGMSIRVQPKEQTGTLVPAESPVGISSVLLPAQHCLSR